MEGILVLVMIAIIMSMIQRIIDIISGIEIKGSGISILFHFLFTTLTGGIMVYVAILYGMIDMV